MSKPLPLDERIKAVLTKTCRSEAAADVLASALDELKALDTASEKEDLASLNPLVTTAEALEIRSRARDLRF